jgi:MYXO-CTERM domain-containing protein
MVPNVLLALSVLVPQADAFAPSDEVHIGVEPTRVLRVHAAHQYRLRRAEAWQDFSQGEGQGWMVRFDERTGTAHRAWGPGIPMEDLSSEAGVEASLRAFMERNPLLIGVSQADLELSHMGHIPRTDTWYVQFQRLENGVPVLYGNVTARIRFGKLILIGVDSYPQAEGVGTRPELSRAKARQAAIAAGPAPDASHSDLSERLVLLPQEGHFGLGFRLVWEARSRTESPVGLWVSHVDAFNGELVNVYNEVRFFEGAIYGTHDERTVDGNWATSPVPFTRVHDGQQAIYTDEDGMFKYDGDANELTTDFIGDHIRVYNENGPNAEEYFEYEEFVWTEGEHNFDLAELDSYIFLHKVRDWGREFAPEVSMSQRDLVSRVNQESSCNAYYDGDVNFMRANNQCNATGRIADVNYHEWGHGFHYYSLESGSWDGSLGEGLSDAVAFFLTGDNIISPYFMKNGSGIRDVAPDRRYPEDWVGEVHADGLIFAGAVWDLWGVFQDELDEDEAYKRSVDLFVNAIKGGPTVAESYDEYIVADDDDGNLGNGTPNQCQIIEAFQRHGLGPMGSAGLIQLNHNPLGNQAAGQPMPISAEIINMASDCVDSRVESGFVHYSTDQGKNWKLQALTLSESSSAVAQLAGELPRFDAGTIVHYYIEGISSDGTSQSAPAGGDINPHSFYVGELVELYCENFEDSNGGGYTHELVSGSNDEGADDWQWGAPAGKAGDPSQAHSGQNLWANDLGWDNYNGEYQNEKHNRLLSIPIDVSEAEGRDLVLQFRRWLTVEDGYYDEARVHVDGKAIWTNHSSNRDIGDEHHIDQTWAIHTNAIADEDGDGTIQVSWEIETDQGLSMGGWNVDDVCVYTIALPPEPEPEPELGDSGLDDDLGDFGLEAGGACACSSQPNSPQTGLMALLLGLVFASRRRRQE